MADVQETQQGRTNVARDRIPHRWRIVVISIVIGGAIAWLWSYRFVDSVIGENIANTLLGHDAKTEPILGAAAGAIFALVSGLAGTFTACNVAVFGVVTPMIGGQSATGRMKASLRSLGWLLVGTLSVSAVYGAIGALLGNRLPQLSTELVGGNLPVRLIQSSIVFGLIGVTLIYLGLAALGIVPDPLKKLSRSHPNSRLVVLGMLVGAFLIGRPFPLFYKLFSYAAEDRNPIYGALVFMLQSLGNVAIMAAFFLLFTWLFGARYAGWLLSKPGRIAVVTATTFLIAGSFTVLYWDLRVPALFGYGWYPMSPWS